VTSHEKALAFIRTAEADELHCHNIAAWANRLAPVFARIDALEQERDAMAAALDRIIKTCQLDGGAIDGIRVDDVCAILADRDWRMKALGAAEELERRAANDDHGHLLDRAAEMRKEAERG
jgi:hypothetical protein